VRSDDEQRALEELERCFAAEAREPHRPGGRPHRPPGPGTVVLLGCPIVVLFVAAGPAAVASLALAAAAGWLLRCLWSHAADGGDLSVPAVVEGSGLVWLFPVCVPRSAGTA
jgi:hypothetical protein